MSTALTLVSLAVVALVLVKDWGHRRVTLFALLRPLVAAAVVVPFVAPGWDASGDGLALEIGSVVVGALLGLLASAFVKVTADGDGQAWTDAGAGYAAVWVVITALRQLFVYGCQHWYTQDLGRFLFDHHISVAAFADSIMFLALAPVIGNRLAILVRSRRVTTGEARPAATPARAPRADASR
ncbi:hypothetical protein [Peterkaempfera griseoplana]|uniref:hypothetical protein n=1 Tax=Peterkaempfera griseoplana TaxID=66896 RepID=UPI0006E3D912|nr:hypothetical protein [Peterkaempfera griseoplana]